MDISFHLSRLSFSLLICSPSALAEPLPAGERAILLIWTLWTKGLVTRRAGAQFTQSRTHEPKRKQFKDGKTVLVGKETDRRWEQGEDPSMVDSSIYTYEKLARMVVADVEERKSLAAIGIRRLMRESKLSQAPVSKAVKGQPVKLRTLAVIRQAAARLRA